jgi:hypothetical protein
VSRAKKPPEAAVGVTLVVEDAALDDLEATLRRARRAGLKGGQILAAVGVITGTADPEQLGDLARVRGIRAAEEDRAIQLPPPDSPQ